tara:strand:- start:244 stop:447 length:204 start_codon:yes stop_codon:yes gene_type:complete
MRKPNMTKRKNMTNDKGIDLVAKIQKTSRDEVEMLVNWVRDYEQGITERAPSPVAKKIAHFVEVASR